MLNTMFKGTSLGHRDSRRVMIGTWVFGNLGQMLSPVRLTS